MKTPSYDPHGVNARPGHASRRWRQLLQWCACWCLVLLGGWSPAQGQVVKAPGSKAFTLTKEGQANLDAQIAAFEADRKTFTPAQQKVEPNLVYGLRQKRTGKALAALPRMQVNVPTEADGLVAVELTATVTQPLLDEIVKLGGVVQHPSAKFHSVTARLPLEQIETLAARADVRAIKRNRPPMHNVGVGEGVARHRADFVQANFNQIGYLSSKVTGEGIKIGVISGDDADMAQAQTDGDLPNNITVLPGQDGTTTEGEGSAMMEIVYEMAPSAQLYFATQGTSQADMAANIATMADDGCNIIIDDVTFFNETPFHESALEKTISDVCAQGVMYFSSAGNSGELDANDSGVWEGDYTEYQSTGELDWGGGNLNQITATPETGSSVLATICWSDPLGNATNDYDLYASDSSGNLYGPSNRFSGQAQDPIEMLDGITSNGNAYLVVKLASGSVRDLHVSVGRAHLAASTNGNAFGHNTATAANAFCVAGEAVGSGTGSFYDSASKSFFYYYSSDGPRHSFYDVDGNAYTPNDLTSTGGKIFNKPDITAATGVKTSGVYPTSSGLNPFYGTSAAAPHAGAIAALLMSYNPQLTPAQIRTAMQSTAIDVEATGFDRDSGYGVVMADAAIGAVGPVTNLSAYAVTYTAQQGEAASQQYVLTITNNGLSTLNYTLADSTGFLKIADTDTYGSAAPGGTATATLVLDTTKANALANGTYTGNVTINDDSGVAEAATAQITLTVGQDTGPSVAVTTPAANAFIKAFSGVSGTASDSAGIAGNSVDFTLYNVPSQSYWTGSGWSSTADQLAAPLNTSTGVWTYVGKLPNAADGTLRQGQYLISAFTYDPNGTVSPSVKNVNNLTITVDTTPPTVAVTAPANNATITAASYTFSGTASDGGGLSYVNAYITRASDGFFWNGTAFTSTTQALNTTFSNGTWTCTSPLPQPGSTLVNGTTYNFFALAADQAGNVTQTPSSVVMVNYHRRVTWTGATLHDSDPNNDSSSWNTAANWSPAVVPGANDEVAISTDDVDLGGNRTVYALYLTSGSINAYTVTVTGMGSSFAGGTMNGTTIKVAAGAFLSIDTSGTPYFYGGALNNAGTVTITQSNLDNAGTVSADAATINNQSGGVIQLAFNGPFFTSVSQQSIFNNSGTITTTTSGVANLGGIDFSNKASGVINTTAGTLAFNSGNVSFAGGSTFTGAGVTAFTTPVTASGTLNVLGTLSFRSGAAFNAATLAQGPGGTVRWDGGSWSGTVNVSQATTLAIDTTMQPQLYGTVLNNFGKIVLSASSAANPQTLSADAAVITNETGGIIQLLLDGQIIDSVSQESTIINQSGGKIVKTTAASGRTLVSAFLENNGTVEADAGTLAFDNGSNGVANTGIFNAAVAAARIEFAAGDFILNTGANFAGPGLAMVTGGNVTMNGAVTVGSSSVAAGGFQLHGGTIDGTGSLNMVSGDGPFIFTTGNMATTLNIVKGATMTVDTTGQPQLYGGTVNNSGTMTLSASDASHPNAFNADASTINNLSGGVIQLGRDGQLFLSVNQQSVINNSGTVTKSAGTGVSDLGAIDLANAASGVLSAASGTVELTSGTITFASGSTVSGKGITLLTTPVTINGNFNVQTTLRFQSGVTYNAATLVQGTGGAMHWDTGSWSGTVTVPAGTTLPVDTTGSPQLYGTTLNNSGTVTLSASDAKNPNAFNADASTINNLSGGVIQLGRDGQMFQSVNAQSVINNSGTVTKTAGTGISDLGNIDYASASTGVFGAASGTVELTSGTVTFVSGSRFAGPGKVFLLADVTFNGATTALTEVHLQGGTKTFNSGASLVQGAGGLLRLDSGTIEGTWAIPAGTMVVADTTGSPQLYGGTLNNSGTLTLSASNASSPGSFNADAAIINNLSGGVIQLARDGQMFQSVNAVSTLSNTGTITKTGGTGTSDLGNITLICQGTLNVPAAGTILLLSGGSTFDGTGSTISGAGIVSSADLTLDGPINIAAGGTLEFGADAGTLTGALGTNNKPLGVINGPGTFLLTGGTITGTLDLGTTLPTTINTVNALLFSGATLNNAGTITITGGKNALQGDNATFNNLAGANLVLQSNAYLQSVNDTSTFVNAGTATLGPKPVIVTTDWIFTQTGTGLLKLAINGTSPTAPGFSQLLDSQAVTLGGTLEGDIASSFKPASKASFEVLTFASHTGDFAKVTYPNAPTGTVLTKTTETEDVKLVAALKPAITSALTASANDGASFTYQIAASNSPASYNATNLPSGLSVDTKTGAITGTLQAAGTFNITISATNPAGTDTETLVLTVKEVAPTITNLTSVTLAQGAAYSSQITATNNPTSYGATGLPTGLSVNASTGAITGTATKAGTYNATLTATNSAGTGSLAVKFTVNPPAPVVTSATTASGNVGTAFSYQIVATNTPTSFNATGLPGGLAVSKTTGVIGGTPTAAGTFTVTLTATNAGGSGTATLTITIKAVPVITSATAETAQQGKAFTYQITATNSPTSYGATGLPSGLTVSASTGAITGTPKNAGSYTVSLKAINASGTGTATLALNVTASAPVITSPKTATATQNSAFSYQIVASNTPTSYGATGLPSGYSVNTKTGVLSGTTTATGTKSITLKAINSAGTGTATLTLTINKASTLHDNNGDLAKTGTGTGAKPTGTVAVAGFARIVSAAVVDAQAGKPFSYGIVANLDATKFTTSDLPGGLELDAATGLITGTPTEIGAYKIGVTAKADTETAKGDLILKIGREPVILPVITSERAVAGEVGQPVEHRITASGNPASFEADGLPEGMSIDPYSGLITGTPTAAGTYPVTLGATNLGGTGTDTLTLTITPAPLPVVTASATVSQAIMATGTAGIITLTLPEALPDDLTVSYEVAGSAINGTDYRLLKGVQTIKAGRTKAVVRITPQGGNDDGATRKVVRFALLPGDGYEVAAPAPVEVEIVSGN